MATPDSRFFQLPSGSAPVTAYNNMTIPAITHTDAHARYRHVVDARYRHVARMLSRSCFVHVNPHKTQPERTVGLSMHLNAGNSEVWDLKLHADGRHAPLLFFLGFNTREAKLAPQEELLATREVLDFPHHCLLLWGIYCCTLYNRNTY